MTYIPRAFILALFTTAITVQAQPYPVKPIRCVVPYPPGGPTDIIGRAIAQKLAEALGQPVIIDNRGGAAGTIGSEQVARAPADGYTLLWGTPGTHGIAPSIYPKLGYDPVKDFTHITLIALGTNLLVVHPSVPARSVAELVAVAKSRPGKLNFGSAGAGATSHMAAEMLKVMSGIDMLHVPFKGAAPAIVALMSGEVDLAILDTPPLLPHVRSGKLRALAVASQRRSRVLPQLPTMEESGLPGYNASSWHGLFAPAGTPRDIVSKLHTTITQIVKLPDITERLSAQGVEPVANTPDPFAEFIKSEIARWARIAKISRAKAE
ncbi:MAG TPA: tripartite tricarboxylate transporter substrate binding protein [Burkholderiales bacterium]|nr:tripartite tricarboxylate transporter substrate binding protein [Burkholderiales bacterium]